MYKKLSAVFIIAGMLCGLCSWPALADETTERKIAPLSPAFIEWLEAQKSGKYSAGQDDAYPKGLIPNPVDLSHLADNPPKLSSSGLRNATQQ